MLLKEHAVNIMHPAFVYFLLSLMRAASFSVSHSSLSVLPACVKMFCGGAQRAGDKFFHLPWLWLSLRPASGSRSEESGKKRMHSDPFSWLHRMCASIYFYDISARWSH
jgi:hypothetical protein